MMDHNEELDRLLRALGTADPAPGLEQRILRQLDARSPMIAAAKPKLGWGGAVWTAGVLAALVVLAMMLHPRRLAGAQQSQAVLKCVPVGPRVEPAPRAHRVRTGRMLPEHDLARAEPAMKTGEARPGRGLADLPSMLAPPEPETKQERLLARIANGPDPLEFDLLNAKARERNEEQSAADFKQFFPPPTPQEIYLAEHTPN